MQKRNETELQQTNLIGVIMFKFRNLLKVFWQKFALICITDKALHSGGVWSDGHYSHVALEGGNLMMYKSKTVLRRMNKNALSGLSRKQRSYVLLKYLKLSTKKPIINDTIILAHSWSFNSIIL